MTAKMKRRKFITLLGGAAVWPLAAHAQQRTRMRRIGVLMPLAADDPVAQGRNAAFLQGLQQLGWTVGQNIQIEYRWCGGNDEVISSPNERAVACASFVVNSATRAPAQTCYGVVRERHDAVDAQSASGRSCCQRVTTPAMAAPKIGASQNSQS